MPVKQISNGTLKQELERAGEKLVLIDFYATWCGPCKMVSPAIEKLSQTYSHVVFLKVDVDQCEDEVQQYKIEAMPTFVFIIHSKEVQRIRGADVDAIETALKKYAKETSAFSGQGHSMLETAGSEHSTINDSDRQRLEKLAKERFDKDIDQQSMTSIRLRLPDISTPVNIRLSSHRTLVDVRQLICDAIPTFQTEPFEFMEPPAIKIKDENETKTLNEAKLLNASLTVKKI